MTPSVALIIGVAFVAALLVMDRRWRPELSGAMWIPVLWALVIGSRGPSEWLGWDIRGPGGDPNAEGSILDAVFYQLMIIVGLAILAHRRIDWSSWFRNNRWLLLYPAYCGLSVLWSDYPVDSFKRWVKDGGNLVMVMVVLTEGNPALAMRALFFRAASVLIPASVILIKYFPELAVYYHRWTGMQYYSGVTTDKNLLGMTLAALIVPIMWGWLGTLATWRQVARAPALVAYSTLLGMAVWLLDRANSATAVICSTIGVAVLCALQFRAVRKNVKRVVALLVVAAAVGWLAGVWSDLHSRGVAALGRDPTLTGRHDIWERVLAEQTNPLFGVGFYSFWMGERVAKLSAGYHYFLNEAHSGYLEIYLNGGIVGVALFLVLLAGAVKRAIRQVVAGDRFGLGRLSLAMSCVIAVYCFSEAIVSRLDLLWFSFLATAMWGWPRRRDGRLRPSATVVAVHKP